MLDVLPYPFRGDRVYRQAEPSGQGTTLYHGNTDLDDLPVPDNHPAPANSLHHVGILLTLYMRHETHRFLANSTMAPAVIIIAKTTVPTGTGAGVGVGEGVGVGTVVEMVVGVGEGVGVGVVVTVRNV
jgi:hypothetical protein